ncbi:MAG: DUF86 domain-containing protein [Nitriliruptor sp.]|nr:MAG: DUF86 domain-containing protein [Nitriliruptor sp.]
MTVDTERLRSLLDRLRDTEKELRRLRSVGAEALRDDIDRMNSVKYLFVVAAEIAIDTGQHIIAAEALDAPGTFADVFRVLGDTGWLSTDLAETFGDIARFRNLLVHGYADVDDDRVLQILSDRLDDLTAFRQHIAANL